MNPKLTLRIAITILVSVFSFSAFAAPKDGAALKKIDEAINVHYLATEFDKAEAMLLGVVKACGTGCSPNVVAKAYMYVGLVRGCGKQNLAGAKEAFGKAKAADPAVALDAALATPEVQAEFNKVTGGGAPAANLSAAGGAEAAEAAAGGITCTPAAGYEIQARQPIPVSCTPPAGVTKGELNYKASDADAFKIVPMKVAGGTLRAQIPCDGVATTGSLKWYVIAQDAKGDTIDTLGNELGPAEFNVVAQSSQPAPAYPGGSPPARCGALSANGTANEGAECPPGMPGCKGGGGWGDSCTPADKCKRGLYCASGTCENAPSCDTNADCDSGRCNDGFCQMGDSAGGGKYHRIMVGIQFAPDLWITSKTKDVCGSTVATDSALKGTYACYQPGSTTINSAPESPDSLQVRPFGIDGGYAGNVNSGVALATVRALLSLDYALTPNATIGGRAGMAFHGGPPSIKYTAGVPSQTTSFLPVHAELRAAYWFKALSIPGIHPYIHVGGGLAQVDGKVKVSAYRAKIITNPATGCTPATANGPLPAGCVTESDGKTIARAATSADEKNYYDEVYYDAWRKMGQGFGTIGGGAIFPLGANGGVQLNLNIMLMLPASGTVLEPSIGYVIGL